MSGRRALALVSLAMALSIPAASTSCGGGPSGTARSTVQGNLADVEQASAPGPVREPHVILAFFLRWTSPVAPAWAQGGLERIRVTIEGTPFGAFTDANGRFVIESPFAGPGTLVFERDEEILVGRLEIDVPAGGKVTLRNVRCNRSLGSCGAERIEIEEPSVDLEPSFAEDPSGPSGAIPSSVGRVPSEPSPSESIPVENRFRSLPNDEHPLD